VPSPVKLPSLQSIEDVFGFLLSMIFFRFQLVSLRPPRQCHKTTAVSTFCPQLSLLQLCLLNQSVSPPLYRLLCYLSVAFSLSSLAFVLSEIKVDLASSKGLGPLPYDFFPPPRLLRSITDLDFFVKYGFQDSVICSAGPRKHLPTSTSTK